MNDNKYSGIWVAAEFMDSEPARVSFELVAKASELARELDTEVTAIAMGDGISSHAGSLIAAGADRVIVVDRRELSTFSDETFSAVLTWLVRKYRPETVLAGATAMGRAYIPRTATLLETGLTADCTDLAIRKEDGVLLQTVPAYGGKLFATIVCEEARPQMATVRPQVFRPSEPDTTRKGDVINETPPPELFKSGLKVIETVKQKAEGPDLASADVVIAAGRGIGSEKNLALVKELAELLGGSVGATRPITDNGWLHERAQIGQTGVNISPKLYIGCGISGAIHHTVGLNNVKIAVTINKDPDAPLFRMSTYGILGDVAEILPLLIREIKRQKGL
jgi:electron transfer flavoprotein alpha subunit